MLHRSQHKKGILAKHWWAQQLLVGSTTLGDSFREAWEIGRSIRVAPFFQMAKISVHLRMGCDESSMFA